MYSRVTGYGMAFGRGLDQTPEILYGPHCFAGTMNPFGRGGKRVRFGNGVPPRATTRSVGVGW